MNRYFIKTHQDFFIKIDKINTVYVRQSSSTGKWNVIFYVHDTLYEFSEHDDKLEADQEAIKLIEQISV